MKFVGRSVRIRKKAEVRPGNRSRPGLWLLALLGSFALGPPVFSAPQNILLIIADDIGADSSSLYNSVTNGASLPPTPTIEALAKRSVVFRNAWACPECSPTRAAILTGRYPFRTGVADAIAMGDPPLSASEFTLPRAFTTNASLGSLVPCPWRSRVGDSNRWSKRCRHSAASISSVRLAWCRRSATSPASPIRGS